MPGRVYRRGRWSWRWRPRSVVVCAALVALTCALGVVAMTQGTIELTAGEVLAALVGTGVVDQTAERVVLGIRLPRLVTGIFVGACLGMAGAIFQSISRNALGSPDIIGLTAGSATGAIVQIVLFDGGPLAVAAWAVGGGLVCSAAVYLLAMTRRSGGGYRLILVGIGVGAFLAAINALLLTRVGLDQALEAEIWLQGSLAGRRWEHALPVLIAFVLLAPPAAAASRRLDLLELGDDTATQLGVRVERSRLALIVIGVGLTALATAAAGPIAFVALAAPQLVRRLNRAPGAPLLSGAVMGSALLVGADLASRHLPFAWSVPVGLATGVLGGVYLLWLLGTTRKV
ncbi:iron chelate uptake ABC transporter family permease subunit [Pengzhenrongella sicca]|uniref:Iron chelate uptake ABC transporter family permease subunit n=1 Tax=Pengzhenrongella sicca TaxID=2819238 RepID=A0A8A4ZLW1_9MICO|nr:iron chelate uptake ABC transporter family permease subunit [Pengzhenrongella sicca]